MPLYARKEEETHVQEEKTMAESKKTPEASTERNGGGGSKSPVKTFGPYGSGAGSFIEVAVWENTIVVEGDREVNVFAVSFSRNYRDGNEWKKTKSLRTQDIPVLQFALSKAYDFTMDSHRNTGE